MDDSSSDKIAQEAAALRLRCEQLEAEVARLKKAEQERKERELIYRQAIQAAGGVPYQLDVHTRRYIYLDPNIEHLLGYPAEEVNAELWQKIGRIHRMRGPIAHRQFREVREAYDSGKVSLWQADYRITTREGETRWLSDAAISVRDEEGNVTESLGFLQDVTDRVLTEKALLESEARFRNFLESMRLIAVQLDNTGTILFANAYLLELTGWQREEILGQNWFTMFVPEEEREEVYRGFLEKTAQDTISPTYENHIQTRTGEKRLVAWHNAVLRTEEGCLEGTASLGIDITESRLMEEHLFHSQKMESIGRLAGGIAHDFNNLLTAILGYTELAMLHSPEDASLQNNLHQVQVAGQRAADMTRQLLAFARKQMIAPRVVDLNLLVENLDGILRRLIGENITFLTHLSPQLGAIKMDTGQMEQVLINLCINARDAMPAGGMLTIETANVMLQASDQPSAYLPLPQGEYVRLSVSDTGAGIAESIQAHIFEPFFTTKDQGKGTGLGLATCHGIISQNGGHIRCDSALNLGTTFQIYLPRTEGIEVTPGKTEASLPRGQETILLVEDEAVVRAFAEQALRQQGYLVLTAAHGLEALQVAEQYRGQIHLLLTDVVMPRMGGVALAERFCVQYPAVRVLMTSGYTDSTDNNFRAQSPEVPFLQKPYTPALLARKVRQVLDDVMS